MRFVLIADTHGAHYDVDIPDGDVLIHAGDILGDSLYMGQLRHINSWLEAHPHKLKIVVPGNHDGLFQSHLQLVREELWSATILKDEELVYEGVNIYGSPWTPTFLDWYFMLDERRLELAFSLIPDDTDILITHGPPRGILDVNSDGEKCGSFALTETVKRVRPELNVFGHIHESYGRIEHDGITYVNASVLDENYIACREPIIWDL